MYRVWYSTKSFADYIIDHTDLKKENIKESQLSESDARNSKIFHTMPDHIKRIMYLDAPDLIIEYNSEPLFSIEISREAGTGHNAFQRYARIAAAVENNVPAIYIYPEASIVSRDKKSKGKVIGKKYSWDPINPLVFSTLEATMQIYDVPALLYYFPSKYGKIGNPTILDYRNYKGLDVEKNEKYIGAPNASSKEMASLFELINELVKDTNEKGVFYARSNFIKTIPVRKRRSFMNAQYVLKKGETKDEERSPLSATVTLPTKYLLEYMSRYESKRYKIGELLRGREYTVFYQVDAKYRCDPYAGCLAAIDYLQCREGESFEDRKYNLVLVWGNIVCDAEKIEVLGENKASINDYFKDIKASNTHVLLNKTYKQLKAHEIPRYYMQARYGSMYSKNKSIRVFSYFADAILFPDGALWRDA